MFAAPLRSLTSSQGTSTWKCTLRLTRPPGATGTFVLSYGPDRKVDTEDDIKSWEWAR